MVHELYRDAVTERWWFRVTLTSELKEFSFESEITYSTREDADQAAVDAMKMATTYQQHCRDLELYAKGERL